MPFLVLALEVGVIAGALGAGALQPVIGMTGLLAVAAVLAGILAGFIGLMGLLGGLDRRLGGRVGGVDRLAGAGHAAHQALAQPQPGLMHSLGAQPFGRAQFQRLRIAEQIDRAHLGPDRIGDVVGDVVEPVLARPRRGKRIPEPLKQLAGFAFGQVSAQLSVPRRAAWPPG